MQSTGINIRPLEISNFIKFGSRIIYYSIHYSNRKTLGIIVTPEKLVKVRAPMGASLERIGKIVRKKAPWIIRNIEYFESLLPVLPPKSYVSGESYYYLGRHYRLKVKKSNLEDVRINKSNIIVYTNHKSNPRVVKTLLEYWYKERAEKKFKERLMLCYESFKNHLVTMPLLTVKTMKTRWGSCSIKKRIILNTELIKTPIRCIDYVIMHELCHLIHRNHDHKFYTLLSSLLPDWKDRKAVLEKSVNKL